MQFRYSQDAASGAEMWRIYAAYTVAPRPAPHHHILVKKPSGIWILFLSDGRELHFQSICDICPGEGSTPNCVDPELGGTARLVRVLDPVGNAVVVEYDRPNGVLLRLADALGHTLELKSDWACNDPRARELHYGSSLMTSYVYAGMELERVLDANGNVLRMYAYGNGSRLIAVLNEAGAALAEFSYDELGRAIGVVDQSSDADVLYDGPSEVVVTEHFTGPEGPTSSSSIRSLAPGGYVTAVSADCACGPAKTIEYTNGRPTCTRDAQGRVTYQEYDALGRLTRRVQHQAGTCAPPSSLPPDAKEVKFVYGLTRQVATGVTLALDSVKEIVRPSTVATGTAVVREVLSYNQTYAPTGTPCMAVPLPVGSVLCQRTVYGLAWDFTNGTPASRRTETFYSYDSNGRLIQTYTKSSTIGYSGATDSREQRSYWEDTESLDRRGRLKEIKRYSTPSSSSPLVTSYDYDLFGVYRVTKPASPGQPPGLLTIIRDSRGRPLVELEPDGGIRETRYWADSLPRLELLPSGTALRFTYDSRGRLSMTERLSSDPEAPGVSPAVGWTEQLTYDAAGNKIATELRDASGLTTSREERAFDVQHRVVRVNHPESPGLFMSWLYDSAGLISSITDEENRVTRFLHDPAGRVWKVQRSGLDALGQPITYDLATYAYQARGDEIQSVTDAAGRATTYKRDDFGRVGVVSSPTMKGGSAKYDYDARGNLLKSYNQGTTLTNTYDGLDRPARVDLDGSPAYTYRYDEGFAGLLTSVLEPERTTSYTYDPAGRIVTEAVAEDGANASLVTRYEYDADGHLAVLTYPSGLAVKYERDPATGNVTQVLNAATGQPFAQGVTYVPMGPLTALTFGNGSSLAQVWDFRHQPVLLQSGPVSLAYQLTPAGNVAQVTDLLQPLSRDFAYDAMDRLEYSPGWLEFAYDGSGSRLSETVDGLAAAYVYASGTDRVIERREPDLAGRRTHAFAYDNQGRLSGIARYDAAGAAVEDAVCLVHDSLGRLSAYGRTAGDVAPDAVVCTSINDITIVEARFKYDYRGRRIARQDSTSGLWRYFISDVAGHLLSELELVNGEWFVEREYVWLDGRPLAQIEYSPGIADVYYYHLDHVGFPRAMTNSNGTPVWTAIARPYGDIIESTSPDPVSGRTVVTNLRLPGQYDERLLGSVGLQGPYYNWHRWYLPSIGRYLELDPPAVQGLLDVRGKVLGPAPEWYAYARGNPLRYTDPMGLYGTKCCTFYERRCAQDPSSTYFCTLAKSVCNRRPKGEPWNDCVRKCLQDMDRAKRNDSDRDQVCKPLPYSTGDFTADHALCFAQCKVDTNSNPFNDTSEPNDDNCEH